MSWLPRAIGARLLGSAKGVEGLVVASVEAVCHVGEHSLNLPVSRKRRAATHAIRAVPVCRGASSVILPAGAAVGADKRLDPGGRTGSVRLLNRKVDWCVGCPGS